jgi:hypothetical protein
VPVKLEEGWQPSDWLGVITAGALWTKLVESDFDQGIMNLIGQVHASVACAPQHTPSTDGHPEADCEEDERSENLFSVDEMRDELERLRADSQKSVDHFTNATVGGECALPAMVPEPLDSLVVSDSMQKLVDTIISSASKRRVGFWGSGGVGKTTTSAWLCRQASVRTHFDAIAWVTLSQTPNIPACQRQLFAQLTGHELPQELSEEDRRIAIQHAFVGKQCLLVLDDAWSSDVLSYFALIDDSTHSRVLISSRVASTLEKCEVVDIGIPTEQDAIQMITAAAGMAPEVAAPEEAREVARLCKHLPLTLGIAGRLVKALELQGEWAEVVALMKMELAVDGEARSAEDHVISTSLREIKGRDADSARALFNAFRLVPANLQSLWMLVGNDDMAISADEFIASLPEPDPLARHGVWKNPDGKAVLHATHFLALTSLVWPALALEKLAVSEEKAASASMAYAAKALEKDHTIGGGTPGHLRTLVHRCCGRILSKRGKMAEARVAFEAAEAEATEREYWMLAALARRDLVEHVIEPSGALGSEGRDGHLAPLVARLVAPKDELATLLGQGFVG